MVNRNFIPEHFHKEVFSAEDMLEFITEDFFGRHIRRKYLNLILDSQAYRYKWIQWGIREGGRLSDTVVCENIEALKGAEVRLQNLIDTLEDDGYISYRMKDDWIPLKRFNCDCGHIECSIYIKKTIKEPFYS